MRPSHRKPLPVTKPTFACRNKPIQQQTGSGEPVSSAASSPNDASSQSRIIPFAIPAVFSVASPVQIEVEEQDDRPFELGDLLTRQWMTRNSSLLISLAFHTFLLLMLSFAILHGTGKALIVLEMLSSPDIEERDGMLAAVEVNLDDAVDLAVAIDNDPFDLAFGSSDGDQTLPDQGDLAGVEGSGVDRSGTGDGKSAKFFGMRATGNSFVYVLDRSGSMAYDAAGVDSDYEVNRFDVARIELLNSVESLRPHQQFYVVLFSTEMRRMFDDPSPLPQPVKATAENKDRLKRWLEKTYANGGTDPRKSLKLAFGMDPDAIFMLSDGEFRDEKADGGPVSIEITREQVAVRRPIQINSIALEDHNSKANMEELSAVTGGQFRFIKVSDYVKRMADSTNNPHFRSRSIRKIAERQIDTWEKRYEIAVNQLIPELNNPSIMIRLEVHNALHALSFGIFESSIPSVIEDKVVDAVRAVAVKEWETVWKKANEQNSLDCSTPIGLFSTIGPVDQSEFLETVETIDFANLPPLNQVALAQGILEHQSRAGAGELSKQLFIDIVCELNKDSKAKFSKASFIKRASHQTCNARLEKVLKNRRALARHLHRKWNDKKLLDEVRLEFAKDLIALYPETGLAKQVAATLDLPVSLRNETD